MITVKVAVRCEHCEGCLLHLVGILSSRFAHDARSQEHKIFNIFHNRVEFGTILEGLRKFEGGGG